MNTKYLLCLDSSFKSNSCYPTKKKSDIESHFSNLVQNIEKKLPGFEDDYEFIESPFSFLEYIGGGQIINELSENKKDELERCFALPTGLKEAMINASNDEQLAKVVDDFLLSNYHRLIYFFMCNIDPILLSLKTDTKLERFPVHENVIELEKRLREWRTCLSTNGRNSQIFYLLCIHFAWHMMVSHKWSDEEDLNRNLLHRLIAFYVASKQCEYNLPGAALFAALKKIILFPKCEQLLDSSLIDYVCRGYFDVQLNKWMPVIVVTSDLKQKDRLREYISGANYTNAVLNRNIITFVPGYLVLVGENGSLEEIEVIDISQYT